MVGPCRSIDVDVSAALVLGHLDETQRLGHSRGVREVCTGGWISRLATGVRDARSRPLLPHAGDSTDGHRGGMSRAG